MADNVGTISKNKYHDLVKKNKVTRNERYYNKRLQAVESNKQRTSSVKTEDLKMS